MNRNVLLFLLLIIGVGCPLSALADDLASSTPETVPPAGATPAPDIATSTVQTEQGAESVASSTELIVPPSGPGPDVSPAVQIELAIESQERTLFRDSLMVTACAPSPDSPMTVSGYCAVEQSGVATEWTWYGSDAFVDTIGGVGNDYVAGTYWNWFSDLSYGKTSLSAHALHPGESLIVAIGRLPLRIESVGTASAGSTTTLSVSQFGFDENFDPVWQPAASSTVLIGDGTYLTDEIGTVSFVPATPGTFVATATKDGYLPAATITVSIDVAEEPGPANGEGGRVAPADPIASALEFLRAHQRMDGPFASPLLSDWAAIAFSSANTSSRSLKRYLASASDTLETATDFERRAMALSAVGIAPQQEIKEIVARFDGVQVGDRSLINDDIFALIALSHGGYGPSDRIMTTLAGSLVRAQQPNGAWASTDLTAAALQALVPLSSLPEVSSSVDKARGYLASHVGSDGCFGNSFTTSWGVMAIYALGESPDAWASPSGATPLSCLRALQAEDGGFEEGASADMRVWATAYAVPALTGQTWDSVLHEFEKPDAMVVREPDPADDEPIREEMVFVMPAAEGFVEPDPVLIPASEPVLLAETSRKTSLTFPQQALAAATIMAAVPSAPEASGESFWKFLVDFGKFLLSLIT